MRWWCSWDESEKDSVTSDGPGAATSSDPDDALAAGSDESGPGESTGSGDTDREDLDAGDEGLFSHRKIDAGDLVALEDNLAGLRPAEVGSGAGPKAEDG